MTYNPFPSGAILTNKQFLNELNLALRSLPEYIDGLVVASNESGCWLELGGKPFTEDPMLLSEAYRLVLRRGA